MKTTARSSAAIVRRLTNSASASCGVRTAVGSSRINTLALRASALRISTRSLFADRKFPDPSGGIDRHVEPLAQFSNLAFRSRTVVASGLSEDDVLCDGERFNQPKVLVNHADSGRDGVFG